jgi:hypothetical protein
MKHTEKNIFIHNTAFRYLGWILIVAGALLALNGITRNGTPSDTVISNSIFGGIGVLVGIIFLLVAQKRKCIHFSADDVTYYSHKKNGAKPIFHSKYADINLLKSFYDKKHRSQNIMLYVDDNDTITFSSSFIHTEQLYEIWQEMMLRCDEYIKKNEISVENELGILEEPDANNSLNHSENQNS